MRTLLKTTNNLDVASLFSVVHVSSKRLSGVRAWTLKQQAFQNVVLRLLTEPTCQQITTEQL